MASPRPHSAASPGRSSISSHRLNSPAGRGSGHGPQPLGDERAEAAASLSPQFREMREVLREFEAQPQGARERASAKDRAFYMALRNLLMEIVRTASAEAQRERQDNAYAWFCRNAPVRLRGGPGAPGDSTAAAKKSGGATRDGMFGVYEASSNPMADDAMGNWRTKDMTRQGGGAEGGGGAGVDDGGARGAWRDGAPDGGEGVTPGSAGLATGLPPSRLFPPPQSAGGMRPASAGGPPPGPKAAVGRSPLPVAIDWGAEDEDTAPTDDRLSELRHRWRMAQADNTFWMAQIRDTMAAWSLHRTRVEEEIARRQEASRYAVAAPRFWPDAVGGVLWAEDEAESAADVDAEFTARPPGTAAPAADGIRSLSPYAGMKPGGQPARPGWSGRRPASASAVEVRRRASEIDSVLTRVTERNNGVVAPGFAERLRIALAVPADRPHSECITRLPMPGSGLEGNAKVIKVKSPKKGGKSKKGKK